jgi:hypothetical protein
LGRHLHARGRLTREGSRSAQHSKFNLQPWSLRPPIHFLDEIKSHRELQRDCCVQRLLHWSLLQAPRRERFKRYCTSVACVEASGTATLPAYFTSDEFRKRLYRPCFPVCTNPSIGCCSIDADSRGEDVHSLLLRRLPLRLDNLYATYPDMSLQYPVATQMK